MPFEKIGTTREAAVVTFEGAETRNIDVRLVDDETGDVIATRRFFHCTGGSWDIAPAVQRTLKYRPTAPANPISLEPCDDRVRCVQLQIGEEFSPELMMMDSSAVDAPFLSAMPTLRLVSDRGFDEVMLMPGVRGVKVIVATEETSEESQRDLATHDLPFVLRFAFGKIGKVGRVECQLFDNTGVMIGNFFFIPVSTPEQALHVAWRSALGTVEHYTFPVCRREEELHGERTDGEREAMKRGARRQRVVVTSAYEPLVVRRALAELGAARQSWVIDRQGVYHPVKVAAEGHVLVKNGDLKALEFTLEAIGEEVSSWF